MKFSKMHSAGSDFICIDAEKESITMEPAILAALMSARRFGVGADGVIFVKRSAVADVLFDAYNPVGSRVDIGATGISCGVKYIYEYGLTNMHQLRIETMSGIKTVSLTVRDGSVRQVNINMGLPVLLSNGLNMQLTVANSAPDTGGQVWEQLEVSGQRLRMIHIGLGGNPYAIFMTEDVERLDLTKTGPLLEKHPRFPERSHVLFMQPDGRQLKLRVWLKDVGECPTDGTGACVAAAAVRLLGYRQETTMVKMSGGTVQVDVHDDGSFCIGANATHVYDGIWDV